MRGASCTYSLIISLFQDADREKIKPTLLLKNCLQAAAARIYDESADVDRATKRIEILLEWLPEDVSQNTGFNLNQFLFF